MRKIPMGACAFGHSATAVVLLENGAVGVNDRDTYGFTPLYFACLSCTADVLLRILLHGAILTAGLVYTSVINRQSQRSRHAQSKLCLQARGQLEEARALCHVPVEHKRPGGCGA